ncbi:hypothetical protein P7C70_g8946, partial [Phenoliferia sp. Uapishka_3]
MNDLTPVTGRGWKSAIRVRLLHAQVRYKIKNRRGREKTYDESVAGVPINQAGWEFNFPSENAWPIKPCGLTSGISQSFFLLSHSRYFQALPRFFLGLSPALLSHCYPSNAPFTSSEIAFASLAFTTFPPLSPSALAPAPSTETATYKILLSISGRPPITTSTIGYHLSYSRLLLGPKFADHLLLPHGMSWDRWQVTKEVWAGKLMVDFGGVWREGWEVERMKLMREVIELLVVWGLGERRTRFQERDEKVWAEKLKEGDSDEPGIKMGKEVGIDVKRRSRNLIAELVAVLRRFLWQRWLSTEALRVHR